MPEQRSYPEVGAPDPELVNSPIADDALEESVGLKQELPGEPVCLFNNVEYPNGTYVLSGSSMLRCDYGIWVPAGPGDPENP